MEEIKVCQQTFPDAASGELCTKGREEPEEQHRTGLDFVVESKDGTWQILGYGEPG